ncbi:hypothetical protein FSP39_018206 [Pinctada imbricata]|uniref:G-protein coupled receptors family 1 profile domain-containing protein n=1 Tax=Pinctada imbricata TaxID=66713 RepID=A0AA88Y7D7_PINIB|nr:hypothetical protein FSP39_018206 [Pinctada imbricata]
MHGMRGSGVDDRVCPTEAVKYPDFTQIHSVYVTLITFYVLVITLAICGNTLVIYTIWRNKSMHTVTNYYIVNLALSDLLVSLFVMPLVLMEYTLPCHWMIFSNDALCAILYYTLPIFVFASILTLVAISLER